VWCVCVRVWRRFVDEDLEVCDATLGGVGACVGRDRCVSLKVFASDKCEVGFGGCCGR
jgi:hypothetical protein